MIRQLMQLIAPNYCCGCGQPGSVLCLRCAQNISNEPFVCCAVCTIRPASTNGLCGSCRPPYKRIWVAGTREGVLDRVINAYKFDVARDAATPLAAVAAEATPELPTEAVLVPIPTARQHIRQRGFDHMKLLATQLATRKAIQLDPTLLGRRTNEVQHKATAIERQKQAKRMFYVRGVVNPEAIYILVDDVMTTGSTVKYAAKTLKDAGALEVWVIIIARQVLS